MTTRTESLDGMYDRLFGKYHAASDWGGLTLEEIEDMCNALTPYGNELAAWIYSQSN